MVEPCREYPVRPPPEGRRLVSPTRGSSWRGRVGLPARFCPAGAGGADGAGAGGVAASSCFGFAACTGGFGVTSRRHDEREANTPWYRMAGMRGGGIQTS